MPGIIVGVDGSGHSEAALKWAMKEAVIRHAPLTVMTVHQDGADFWTGNLNIFGQDQPGRELACQAVQKAADKAAARLGDSRPASVTVRAVSGTPAEELINAARDTDLMVVGSRGSGGFARLLMGSVNSQVANHAGCPVVIVRPKGG
jgi:nucleotide-binding universal stress UspA family protein